MAREIKWACFSIYLSTEAVEVHCTDFVHPKYLSLKKGFRYYFSKRARAMVTDCLSKVPVYRGHFFMIGRSVEQMDPNIWIHLYGEQKNMKQP